MQRVLAIDFLGETIIDIILMKMNSTNLTTFPKNFVFALKLMLFHVVCPADAATDEKWIGQISRIDLAILGHQPGVSQQKMEINDKMAVLNQDCALASYCAFRYGFLHLATDSSAQSGLKGSVCRKSGKKGDRMG